MLPKWTSLKKDLQIEICLYGKMPMLGQGLDAVGISD